MVLTSFMLNTKRYGKGVVIMEEDEKRIVVPNISVNHNDDDTGLEVRVDIAGASKESVDLDVGDEGFCIKAEAEDLRYESCYMLAHEIKREEARARFDSGLLRITVPFRNTLHGHKVAIE